MNGQPSRKHGELNPATIRRIAVVRALDPELLLPAVPAMRALRSQFPAAEITLVGLASAADFVQRVPWFDRLVTVPLARVEDDASFDLAIQLQDGEAETNDLLVSLGAPVTVAFSTTPDARLTVNLPWNTREHETLRWLRLAAQTGAISGNPRLELPLRPHEAPLAYDLLGPAESGRPLVGINLGAVSRDARWPVRRWVELAKQLHRQWNARIVLFGSATDGAGALALLQALPRRAVTSLIGIDDIGVKAAAIGRLDLLISADAGEVHLAAAMGTSTVDLFGPTEPERWAPLDSEHHIVVDAAPACRVAADGRAALDRLATKPVFRVAAKLLEQQGWSRVRQVGLARWLERLVVMLGLEPVHGRAGGGFAPAHLVGGGSRYQ